MSRLIIRGSIHSSRELPSMVRRVSAEIPRMLLYELDVGILVHSFDAGSSGISLRWDSYISPRYSLLNGVMKTKPFTDYEFVNVPLHSELISEIYWKNFQEPFKDSGSHLLIVDSSWVVLKIRIYQVNKSHTWVRIHRYNKKKRRP